MKSSLEALIDDLTSADDLDLVRHREMLDSLKAIDIGKLSARECAKGYAHLQNVILFLSAQARVVDPKKFPDELSALFQFSAALRYSNTLHDWMTKARQDCARHLREDTDFIRRDMGWDKASPDERLTLIRDLVGSIMAAHSDDRLAFQTPAIDIDDSISGYGAFTTHAKDGGAPAVEDIKIHFGRKLLERNSSGPALIIAYHEAVHVITTQLALAAHNNIINETHPLHRDALINLEKLKANAVADKDIPDHYHYDCDEELAHHHQDHFLPDLYDADPNDPGYTKPNRPINPAGPE
jgi:hypothetical protein